MNESAFPDSVLSDASSDSIFSLLGADDGASFSQLVKIAGLIPSADLRHADLRGVDFSNSDLRGYDFTGSDLRGSGGVNIVFDHTTITDQADVDGSIFATRNRLMKKAIENPDIERLARRLQKEDWADQLIWCFRNFLPNAKYRKIATYVATLLYQNSTSQYTQSQLIPYIIKSLSRREQINFLISTISQDRDTIISRLALEQLMLKGFGDDPAAQIAAWRLVNSSNSQTQLSAIRILVRFPESKEAFDRLINMISGNRFLESAYVSEIAANISREFRLVTRDPYTNESFILNEIVDKIRLRRIAVRWLRAEYELNRGDKRKTILDMPSATVNFQYDEIIGREKLVLEMWRDLEVYGIRIFQT